MGDHGGRARKDDEHCPCDVRLGPAVGSPPRVSFRARRETPWIRGDPSALVGMTGRLARYLALPGAGQGAHDVDRMFRLPPRQAGVAQGPLQWRPGLVNAQGPARRHRGLEEGHLLQQAAGSHARSRLHRGSRLTIEETNNP